MAQQFSNEPLSGLLTAATWLLLLVTIRCAAPGARLGPLLASGLALGWALLAKVTVVLLLPAWCVCLVFVVGRATATPLQAVLRCARALAAVLGVAVLVAGWYYARNWWELGSPFIGGWDPARGFRWWQDPGYRNAAQFLSFGESLTYPVFASLVSVWDAFYSTFWLDGNQSGVSPGEQPPWNWSFALAGAWWGVVPSLGLFAGCGVAASRFLRRGDATALFLLGSLASYGGAMLYFSFTVPVYSAQKAHYALGLLPCITLLMLLGFDLFWRWRFARACIVGWVSATVSCGYCAYFIL